MKHLVRAIALTLVVSGATMAGDMHGNDSPGPGPSPTPLGMKLESSPLLTSIPVEKYYADPPQSTLADSLDVLLSVFGLVF